MHNLLLEGTQQLRHIPATPSPYTHFLVLTPSWTTTAMVDANTTALSVSRKNPRHDGMSGAKCTKLFLFQSPSSAARMNTTSWVQDSHHQGHLCLIVSPQKLPGQQGKAGNNVSIHLAATQTLALRQMAINSTPSPLDGGLARPPPSLHYQVRGCPLSCTRCDAILQNVNISSQPPNKHPQLADEIPVLLPTMLQQYCLHLHACWRWECCQSLYGWGERRHSEKKRSGSTDLFFSYQISSQRHQRGCEGQTGERNHMCNCPTSSLFWVWEVKRIEKEASPCPWPTHHCWISIDG